MSDTLEEYDGKLSIDGRNITNLQFADDKDALAEVEQELRSPRRKSQQHLHKILDGDQCRENQPDNKQCLWHPDRDKGKKAEAGHCNKLQVPWSSCFR